MNPVSILLAILPSRALIVLSAGGGALCTVLAFTALAPSVVALIAVGIALALLAILGIDVYLSMAEWRRAPLTLCRRLPHAFAVGAPVSVRVSIENPGRTRRRGRYFELADAEP